MQELLLLGNYMETSSAEEFTYAEVVYAVYCYLYEFFFNI